jgi:pimeloyl-ACP methyl ester carboxylesterase
MAGDVAGLMDRLDLPRAHVLGISMGGRIALALALAQPARVNQLVLVVIRRPSVRVACRPGPGIQELGDEGWTQPKFSRKRLPHATARRSG